MTYRITYTTDTVPENLPEGYIVEKVSNLPLMFKGRYRVVGINKSAHDDDLAFISVDGNGEHLTREQTIQVRDALNELLEKNPDPLQATLAEVRRHMEAYQREQAAEWDGYSEPPADVVETKDRGGDHWYRLSNGNWDTLPPVNPGSRWEDDPGLYGPHTIVARRGS